MSPNPPRHALFTTLLPEFDLATRAVARGVLVEGRAEQDVAAELGVSRRTVARKVARFLEAARARVAVAVAAAAVAGCAGGLPANDATSSAMSADPQRASAAAQASAPERDAAQGVAAPRARSEAGARDDAPAPAEDEGAAVAAALAPPEATPQQPRIDQTTRPIVLTVWPESATAAGGAVVVISGRNLDAAQVLFGTTPGKILDATGQKVAVEVPEAHAGRVALMVTNRDGSYALAGEDFQLE